MLLGSWAARVPAVKEARGLGEAELGLMLLFMGLGALASFGPAGRVSDRIGAVTLTRGLALAYLAALPFLAVAPGTPGLALALFFFGITHGAMDVAMNSWGAEVERRIGRPVMSGFHAMWSLGAGAGAGLGFAATSLGAGVALHFTLAALVGLVLLCPFLLQPWTSARREGPGGGAPVFALPRGALVPVGMIGLASGLGEGGTADWSAIFLSAVAGAGESQATLGYALFAAAMLAMRLCTDRLARIAGPARVARAGALVASAGLALLLLPAPWPVALAGFALMGLGYAPLYPLCFSRAAADPDIPPGQAIAGVATLGYGSVLMGPPLIGLIADLLSLRAAFLLVALAALAAALLAPSLATAARSPGRTG
ncbi:MFS transporter [Mangrovicoccus sp. HB182678]|uniref:MFS transporter n=2 Tax=Mangrovicoccus algicola TaxID=2771008 RepID=A0A8J6YY56_9RHOB|nr:MFS transporter [Mangrovicoccus algicola]MBE3637913.1 MFS transporter [Mangrovicoccus algicola]